MQIFTNKKLIKVLHKWICWGQRSTIIRIYYSDILNNPFLYHKSRYIWIYHKICPLAWLRLLSMMLQILVFIWRIVCVCIMTFKINLTFAAIEIPNHVDVHHVWASILVALIYVHLLLVDAVASVRIVDIAWSIDNCLCLI